MTHPTQQLPPGGAPPPPGDSPGGQPGGGGRRGRVAGGIVLAVGLVIALVVALVVLHPWQHQGRHKPGVVAPTAAAPSAPAKKGKKGGSSAGGEKIHRAARAAGTPCVVAPRSCGYPDASNTGVPAGTALRPAQSLTVDKPGSTVSGLDITGSLHIAAPNVTVRDVRVSCPAGCDTNFLIRVDAGLPGVLIEDSELAGTSAVHTGIGGGGAFTARRINLHDVNDGVHLQSGALIEDSYIHDLAPTLTVHADAVQIIDAQASNVTIRHNTLLPFNPTTLVYDNSAVICGSQCTSTTDLLVERNLMDGGSQTLKCPDQAPSGNVYRDNVFGLDFRFAAVNGACALPGNSFVNNTFDGSGRPVVPGNGKGRKGG